MLKQGGGLRSLFLLHHTIPALLHYGLLSIIPAGGPLLRLSSRRDPVPRAKHASSACRHSPTAFLK